MQVEYKQNYAVKNLTSFKIGGNVEKIYFPKTQTEFVYLLKTLYNPLVFGNWSNVLISSQGISQSVISTSKLNNVEFKGTKVFADCGVKGPLLSQLAMENELSGFEFMIGFPGSVGGNVYMNASAHLQCISDFLTAIKVFDMQKKEVIEIDKKTLGFAYRSSILQKKPYILISAEFDLKKASKEEIQRLMTRNLEFRKNHQPNLATPNAGSIFRNPEDTSAGKLLDSVGVKRFEFGGAKVWEHHANFIVNKGDATSTDVLELMLKMYVEVRKKYNINLEPEVKFFGDKSNREEDICRILYSQK